MITKYIENRYEITDVYKNIQINAKAAAVKIEPSNDNNTKVVLLEKKRQPYSCFVTGDTLTIKPKKDKWYNSLTIGINRSVIKLYLSKAIFDMISVKTNVGNIDISSIICNGTIEVKINTGNINLENVKCKYFNSKGNTGSVSLKKIFAEDSISIKHNTGAVLLNDCSAPDLFVKTNTGRVSGIMPSNTVFKVRTNTGKVEIPKATIGEIISGRCEIRTNTGNIKITEKNCI